MAAITCKNLGKIYGGSVRALEDINLDIEDGEFIVLVGPSGCGKSTLLRMVAGLETVSEGEITIGGRRVNELEPSQRDIAMVFQNYALYPHMSVRKNLSYGLRNRRVPRDEINRRVAHVANILGLEPYLDRKPRQLSGGQRQRVAMGRAIVREPVAFLFDEPLSNLDAKLRVQMRAEIRKLHQQMKTTSLYVTHDQLEAMTLADRLVVMNGGKVEQIGTPMALYTNPQTLFVATFIGSPAMNIIDPAQDRVENIPQIEKAFIGLRPQDLKIVDEKTKDSSSPTFSLLVDFVEPIGSETYLYGKLEGSGQEVTVIVSGYVHFDSGTQVRVAATADKLYRFDKKTGERIV